MTSSSAVGGSTEYGVQERTIDSATNTLTISGQPVYRPYEMVVLAANEMGEAASRPRPVVGYSSEAGTPLGACFCTVLVLRSDTGMS